MVLWGNTQSQYMDDSSKHSNKATVSCHFCQFFFCWERALKEGGVKRQNGGTGEWGRGEIEYETKPASTHRRLNSGGVCRATETETVDSCDYDFSPASICRAYDYRNWNGWYGRQTMTDHDDDCACVTCVGFRYRCCRRRCCGCCCCSNGAIVCWHAFVSWSGYAIGSGRVCCDAGSIFLTFCRSSWTPRRYWHALHLRVLGRLALGLSAQPAEPLTVV